MKWWNVMFGFGDVTGWHSTKQSHESGRLGEDTFGNISSSDVNPASGLPMMDDSMDVAGNPFGMDLSDWHHDMGMGLDDPFSTTDWFSDDLGGGIGSDW